MERRNVGCPSLILGQRVPVDLHQLAVADGVHFEIILDMLFQVGFHEARYIDGKD